MLTYTGTFDKEAMIAAAKRYAPLHLNKNNKDESEVPFQELSTGIIGYVQFVNVAGSWIYVRVRCEK